MNFILIFLSAFSLLFAQPKPRANDLEKQNLKGNVKSIKQTMYASNSDSDKAAAPRKLAGYNIVQFNPSGNIAEMKFIDEKGNSLSESKYIYNRNGILQEIEEFVNGTPDGRKVNSLEGHHIMQSKSYNAQNELLYTIKYSYSGGRNYTATWLNKDNEVDGTITEIYTFNMLTKQEAKDANGKLKSAVYNKHNAKNEVESEVLVEGEKKTTNTYRYEHDQNQNWVKQHRLDANGKVIDTGVREITYYPAAKKK